MFTVIPSMSFEIPFDIQVTGETETHILYRRVGIGSVQEHSMLKTVWKICVKTGGIVPKIEH